MINHWGRRQQRRGPAVYQGRYGNSWKSRCEDALRTRVEQQMVFRSLQLNPFPFKPLEVYNAIHTVEERNAMDTLAYRFKGMMKVDDDLVIKFEDFKFGLQYQGTKHVAMGMTIQLPSHLPMCEGGTVSNTMYEISMLPEWMRNELLAWAKRWVAYELQGMAVSNKLEELFRICNTMGHVRRLWPAIEGFLPEEGRAKLVGKKTKSPYPILAMDVEADDWGKVKSKKLKPEWQPSALKVYELLISEALVMAELKQHWHPNRVDFVPVR